MALLLNGKIKTAGLHLTVGEEAMMARTAQMHGTRGEEMSVGQCCVLVAKEAPGMRRLEALNEAG